MPMLVKNSYFHQHYVCFATFHIWKRPQCVCLCVCVCRDRLFIRYYLSLFYFYFLPVFSPFLFIIFINIPCSPIYEVTFDIIMWCLNVFYFGIALLMYNVQFVSINLCFGDLFCNKRNALRVEKQISILTIYIDCSNAFFTCVRVFAHACVCECVWMGAFLSMIPPTRADRHAISLQPALRLSLC